MEKKPFSIGVRIEHPQEVIDVAQYGRPARELGLPPAEYKLSYRCAAGGPARGRGVYTFCMCPGGRVIPASSEAGAMVVNGMSDHARDSGTANSALLCDVRVSDLPGDDVLAGVEFQRRYEKLAFEAAQAVREAQTAHEAQATRAAQEAQETQEAKTGRETQAAGEAQTAQEAQVVQAGQTQQRSAREPHDYTPPQATWGAFRCGLAPQVRGCLPDFAVAAFLEAMPRFGRTLRGFDNDDARLIAVETRSSSPVRILRNDKGEGRLAAMAEGEGLTGFYPCGEGAGYAGGITSAAVDGIRTAEKIIGRWLSCAEILR